MYYKVAEDILMRQEDILFKLDTIPLPFLAQGANNRLIASYFEKITLIASSSKQTH